MGRNIVLCFDGTKNQYTTTTDTNVVKLYAMLDRSRSDQLAYYQPGIGTYLPPGAWGALRRWIVTRLDLAIAWLLQHHVTDAYRFLMRCYQEGDRIFIFGFSRGAYTAKVLSGMLNRVGLLSYGNEELIQFAWRAYRSPNSDASGGFKIIFCRPVEVHFLGLWDSVSSVGWIWNPTFFYYTSDNPNVKVIRHAVALDERRSNFRPGLWRTTHTNNEEVWFVGVHCDVGGGYSERESGLSKIPLKWMVDQAKLFGLYFDAERESDIIPKNDYSINAAPNAAAQMHESLKGLWWAAEYLPIAQRLPDREFAKRFTVHRGKHRYLSHGSKIHASVFERMKEIPTYRPPNIPADYLLVEEVSAATTEPIVNAINDFRATS
jgi:uncharacterized protein (DUF2235 family)